MQSINVTYHQILLNPKEKTRLGIQLNIKETRMNRLRLINTMNESKSDILTKHSGNECIDYIN